MIRMRAVACAAFTLTLVSSSHVLIAQQSDAARKALETAAAKGSAPAQYALGAAAEADGDLAQAVERYQQAAAQGYAAAQFKLGELYETGKGVDADRAQAMDCYRQAAAQGLAQASERLHALDPTAVAPTTPAAAAPTDTPTPPTPAPVESPRTVAPPEGARPSAPVAAPSSTTPPAATGTPIGFAPWDRLPAETQNTVELVYIGISTLLGWLLMRPVVMRWFRGSTFFITGNGVREMFMKTVRMRLQAEGLAISLGAVVGCLGGNVWFILSRAVRLFGRRTPTPETTETA